MRSCPSGWYPKPPSLLLEEGELTTADLIYLALPNSRAALLDRYNAWAADHPADAPAEVVRQVNLDRDVSFYENIQIVTDPDSLTVHALAIKRAAQMGQEKRDEEGLEHWEISRMIRDSGDAAKRMGMVPYYLYRQKNMAGNFENVGYAREGKAGLYNILMMEEKQDILALGAGSISKRLCSDGRIERCENVKDVAQYIERIGEMIERKRHLLAL